MSLQLHSRLLVTAAFVLSAVAPSTSQTGDQWLIERVTGVWDLREKVRQPYVIICQRERKLHEQYALTILQERQALLDAAKATARAGRGVGRG